MPLPIFSWQSSQPLLSHNFVVFVGVMPIPFSKVSSVEVSIETEALAEGGENRFVHSMSKPVTAEKTLVLERGADSGLVGSVLMTLANTALRVGSVYDYIAIAVLDQWGLPKKLYTATHCILKRRRFSDLNAMSGEVFIETLEFIYRDMTEVPGVNAAFSGIAAGVALAAKSVPKSVPKPFTLPLN
ncbi:MAG: phage tail protein [Oscillospiraceae bacterium]|nr:phage tail protein [Oscillospiraceae bacterium]